MAARSQLDAGEERENEPLTVRFSNQFLSKFSRLLADSLTAESESGPEVVGLLFGAAGGSHSIVQNFRVLLRRRDTESKDARNVRQAFQRWQSQSGDDSELTWLDLLGWFCLRPNSAGELLASDVQFHNSCFRAAGSLTAIIYSPGIQIVAAELYSSVANAPLDIKKHRRVSVHVQIEANGMGVGSAIRPKTPDNVFLKAYAVSGALDRAERWQEWKERARWLLRFQWLRWS